MCRYRRRSIANGGDPWYERVSEVVDALNHTRFITNWDDEITSTITKLYIETLHFDLERWKVYVELGNFLLREAQVGINEEE